MKKTIGFFGLGLIGGSIAKAIREQFFDYHLMAYDTNLDSLKLAKDLGIINTALTEISDDFSCCDYIFLCAPVQANVNFLKELISHLGKQTIITDVSSVKESIHKEIRDLNLEHCFIGGHPMAGSERFGFINAKSSLLENAYYIITPTSKIHKNKLEDFVSLISSLKAIPFVMEPKTHDFATAAVSHLPHLLAYALVSLVKEQDNKEEVMKTIAAGGFKDITRIASSSPVMWQQICLENQDNLLFLLDEFMKSLDFLKHEIENQQGKSLQEYFQNARDYRDSFIDASAGPLKKVYTIYLNIPDRSGPLASITGILATHDINIKNMGITHNREYEEGVLRLEFYDEEALKTATNLLQEDGYLVVTHH